MKQKIRTVKKPVLSACGVLCSDIYTLWSHELCCENCREKHEFINRGFEVI